MTITQLVQLYAPLAGLLGITFWLGMLTQRVRGLEVDAADLKRFNEEGGSGERLVRLEVKMEDATRAIGSLDRSMQGVQRTLANWTRKTTSPIHEFGGDT